MSRFLRQGIREKYRALEGKATQKPPRAESVGDSPTLGYDTGNPSLLTRLPRARNGLFNHRVILLDPHEGDLELLPE